VDESERHLHAGFVKVAPWIIAAVIAGATGVVAMSVHDELGMEDNVEVTAHRGSSKKAPENTLSAITQAIEDRADYAEIDVQETADGVVVLLHDSDLMRLAGVDRKIWDATYSEIASLDVGIWFSPQFSHERIPTLDQAIATARGRIKLNIELKYNGHDKRLAEEVVEIVRKNGFGQECVITSLDYEGLLTVRRLDGRIKTGHIVAKAIGDIMSSDVDVLSVQWKLASADFIAKAQKNKKEVHVWTINDSKLMERFIDLRVDNIITDHPDLLVQILQRRSRMSDMERLIQKLESWIR
jgi:glycerophosphoryl diester phosphodiesterase